VDHAANKRIYGKEVRPSDVLDGKVPPPSAFSFQGFSRLIDDLHQIEEFASDNKMPLLERSSLRSDFSNHRPHPAYSAPRGFHRYGSSGSRSSRLDQGTPPES
jgi:hypothetical protein